MLYGRRFQFHFRHVRAGAVMRRSLALFLLLLVGCSTAPLADLMDFFQPGKLSRAKTAPYGGVCVPRPLIPPGPVACPPAGPAVTGPAVPPPAAVPPPVVPPPPAPPTGL
jgi:hypothetical protein